MLLYSFLQNHYSPPIVSTPDFVTAMTTALVNACMSGIIIIISCLATCNIQCSYHNLPQDIHIILYDHVPCVFSVVSQVYILYLSKNLALLKLFGTHY